jgi:hypothetical protein
MRGPRCVLVPDRSTLQVLSVLAHYIGPPAPPLALCRLHAAVMQAAPLQDDGPHARLWLLWVPATQVVCHTVDCLIAIAQINDKSLAAWLPISRVWLTDNQHWRVRLTIVSGFNKPFLYSLS